MPFWLAVILFIVMAVGVVAVLLLNRYREKRVLAVIAASAMGVLLLAVVIYIVLTVFFVSAVD